MKIGIVGAGFIGRGLARLAKAAGYEVMISNSRDPRTLASTGVALGAQVGTAEDAVNFGEVVVVSIPFFAIPQLDPALFEGKTVIDTCNYYPERDGEFPELDSNDDTTGEFLARQLPGAHVIKAFNAILQGDLETDPKSKGETGRRALPIAGDDENAKATVARIVDDFGFDPYDVGNMADSWRFERGKPSYCIRLDEEGLKDALSKAEKGVTAPMGSWRKAPAQPKPHAHTISDRGTLDIVDGQFHLGNREGVASITTAMDALGIRSLIADELWNMQDGVPQPSVPLAGGTARPLSVMAQQAALQSPERFAYVQRVVRHDPHLDSLIPMLSETPGCLGLRVVLSSKPERTALIDGEWDRVFGLAADAGLPVCLLSANLSSLAGTVMDRFANLTLIVDHCGWCSSADEWPAVLKMADQSGAFLKWSHPNHSFRHFDDSDDAEQRALPEAVRAFGAERIFWASDTSYEETGRSWAELLGAVRYHPDLSNDERESILAGTARKIFKWNI